MTRIQIAIDQDGCVGHGQCELIAPEYFELREDGLAYPLKDDDEGRDEAVLQEAVVHCPAAAITLFRSER